MGAQAPDSGKEEILASEGVLRTPKSSWGLSFSPLLYPSSTCTRVASVLSRDCPARARWHGAESGRRASAWPCCRPGVTSNAADLLLFKSENGPSRNVSGTLPTPERAVLLAVVSRALRCADRHHSGSGSGTRRAHGSVRESSPELRPRSASRDSALVRPRAVFSVYFFQSTRLTFKKINSFSSVLGDHVCEAVTLVRLRRSPADREPLPHGACLRGGSQE